MGKHLVPGFYISVINLFTAKAYILHKLILAHKSQPVEIIKVVTSNPHLKRQRKSGVIGGMMFNFQHPLLRANH